MSKIYVTSDLHFCHAKPFIYEARGFENVYKMNIAITENWYHTIKNDDDVYVLGDLMLSNDEEGLYLIKQLQGKLHIVRGNHDSDRRIELYRTCPNIVSIQNSDYIHYNGFHFYLSHYPTLTSNFDYDKPLKARTLNLCGHTHTTDKFSDWDMYNAPIYHCDLDAHNCTPIVLDDIIADIKAHENLMK